MAKLSTKYRAGDLVSYVCDGDTEEHWETVMGPDETYGQGLTAKEWFDIHIGSVQPVVPLRSSGGAGGAGYLYESSVKSHIPASLYTAPFPSPMKIFWDDHPFDTHKTAESSAHQHTWKEYVGFTERYEYCETCDEKKA